MINILELMNEIKIWLNKTQLYVHGFLLFKFYFLKNKIKYLIFKKGLNIKTISNKFMQIYCRVCNFKLHNIKCWENKIIIKKNTWYWKR